MEVNYYLKKFTLLLEYVFEGKVLLNENNTEKLLKFLEDRSEKSPGKSLVDTPKFSDLIFHSLEKLHNSHFSDSVNIFLVKVVTILFKNELQFTKMQMQGFQNVSIKYCILGNLKADITSPELDLACIKLATVQVTHCSGITQILEHKVWKHILCPKISQKPVQISKAAYNFFSQLILKLNDYENQADLIEVLEYVVKPIITSEYITVEEIDPETDRALAEKIVTHMQTLMTILSDTENVPVNHIVPILRTNFFIESSLFTISKVTRCSYIRTLINDLCLSFYYASSRHLLFSNRTDEFCNEMIVFYHNFILQCIKKRDSRALIDFSIKCTIFWYNFEKTYKDILSMPLKFQRNGQKFELCNQLIVHPAVPLLCYVFKVFENQPGRTPDENEDFSSKFQTKLGKIITEHIFSSCYLYRALIEESDMKQTAIDTIRELFRLKGYLTPQQAGIYFQCFFHLLDTFILSDGAGGLILNENPIRCPSDVRLLSLVLDALRMLLKEHNILWYENVEIVTLQGALMNLLKQDILNSKQVVQVLDLIDICVKKFLSPNMTLLVETRHDSTLTEIGAVMKLYMHHEDWEVRDSALNLLLRCTDISFIKYIPLQKVISENSLMFFAAKIALTDPEYYAQSTALKCLASATKIEGIWQEVLVHNPHIYLQLVYILRNNPEGMVRKEAVKVLTRVYINQKVSPNFKSTLYEVMMAAALDDLHWEVQLAALQFWKHEINSQLTYRGMIDGKFPSVTFSKEKRKIITLNEDEIIRQLTSIMHNLSAIGCLTVLYECMNEVYNIEIMEQAYCMAKELIEILDKYKFGRIVGDSIIYQHATKETVQENHQDELAMDLTCTLNSEEIREQVIDSILNTDQSELIINLHDNYFKTQSHEMEEDYGLHIPRKQMIHPNTFLETFKGTDFVSIIKDKNNWNADIYDSLDVLLDELLNV